MNDEFDNSSRSESDAEPLWTPPQFGLKLPFALAVFGAVLAYWAREFGASAMFGLIGLVAAGWLFVSVLKLHRLSYTTVDEEEL